MCENANQTNVCVSRCDKNSNRFWILLRQLETKLIKFFQILRDLGIATANISAKLAIARSTDRRREKDRGQKHFKDNSVRISGLYPKRILDDNMSVNIRVEPESKRSQSSR